MAEQRILVAVAVDDEGQVSGHAGRAECWQVFDLWPGDAPRLIYTVNLESQSSLHLWHTQAWPERHPLHAVDVAIAASAGDGVIRRLASRDTLMLTTRETDPLTAVRAWRAGTLPEGLPHDEHSCGGEGHQHEDDAF